LVIVPEAIAPTDDIVIRQLPNTQPANRDLVVMGGIVAFRFQGGDGYNGDDLIFKPEPAHTWRLADKVVPIVTHNSFEHTQNSSGGWAVDSFRPDGLENGQIRLRVRIACWGRGAFVQRVAYHVTALGLLIQ
jgi:hypothetical protein